MRNGESAVPIWEDPEVTNSGRLAIHSALFPFPDMETAFTDAQKGPRGRIHNPGELANSPWVLSLDGSWRFFLAPRPNSLPEAWNGLTFDDSGWPFISVPGSWCLQGFDKPHYTNVLMPFPEPPPASPHDNPTGLYRLRLKIPAAWMERRLILRIGSAESCLFVYANGHLAGFSKDSHLPAEFELSPFIKGDELLLALAVIRYSDSSFIEDQDNWWLGGLHRSICLYSPSSLAIADIDARAILNSDYVSGKVELAVELDGDSSTPYNVSTSLRGLDGVEKASVSMKLAPNYQTNQRKARFVLSLSEIEPWTAETPKLYVLVCSLSAPDGRLLESRACRLGFRTVEVRDRSFRINNKSVYIKGVNRHEHHELHGRTLSITDMVKDIELLKRHNFNAVRTSHYPNDERWYELCDEYGLYVFDEANIESHAYYDTICRDPRWLKAFVERVSRMVLRDKNHACVVAWSLGNESGYGPNHDAAAGWVRRFDPSRPLHYEGVSRPEWGQAWATLESLKRGRSVSDFVCPMYPSLALIMAWDRTSDDDRPMIMCEYSHAMGNSNGGLAAYWAAIEAGRGLRGGFIWEWADHAFLVGEDGVNTPSLLEAPGPNAICSRDMGSEALALGSGKPWRYGGDFGDEPSDRDFISDGLLFPDRQAKPALAECAYLFQPFKIDFSQASSPFSGCIRVQSRYSFRVADGFKLNWSVHNGAMDAVEAILASDSLTLPPIGPEEAVTVDLGFGPDLLARIKTAGLRAEVVLHIDIALGKDELGVPKGAIIAKEALTLSWISASPFSVMYQSQRMMSSPVGLGEGSSRTNVSAAFSEEGFLCSLKGADGAEWLSGPLRPCLFRAPTQNDGLKNFIERRGQSDYEFYYKDKVMYDWLDWGLAELRYELLEDKKEEKRRCTQHRLTNPGGHPIGEFYQDWDFDITDGSIIARFRFSLENALCELPRLGVACRLRAAESVAWFGLGPHEAYSDRAASARLGRWSASLESLSVPYIMPQENGNRHKTRWLAIHSGSGGGALNVAGASPFDFSLTPYSVDDLWRTRHWDCLPKFSEAKQAGVYLHLDIAQRGLGTASCGPDTAESYRIRPGLYELTVRFSA